MTDIVPPHDIEAEIAVLGAMLLDVAAARDVAGFLTAADFYGAAHASAFRVFVEMLAEGKKLDIVLVRERLHGCGLLESVGGTSFLSRLVASVPSATNGRHYAEIVRARANERAMKGAAQRVVDAESAEDLADAVAAFDRTKSVADAPRSGGIVAVRVADVKAERVRWLWPKRLPLGKLVVLDGDPGLGKSTLTLDIAARVTRGAKMPDSDEERPPAAVLIASLEDDVADTIRPRLEAAGADLQRVFDVRTVRGRAQERLLVLPDDVQAIEAAIVQHGAALVVIDPVMAILSGQTDAHRDQDVRGALAPLAAVAARTGACIVIVRHLNKSAGGSAIYRGGGSIGIIGAARAGLLVARNPDDPTSADRVFAVTKSNLGPEAPSLAFRLVPVPEHDVARVEWLGESKHSAEDLVAVHKGGTSPRNTAEDFLREMLADGPVPALDVLKAAAAEDIATRTVYRAKKALGVLSKKDGMDGGWRWRLPESGDAEDRHDSTKMANLGGGDLRGQFGIFGASPNGDGPTVAP